MELDLTKSLGEGEGDVYECIMGLNFVVLGIYVQGVAFKLIYLNILRAHDDTNNCFEGCKSMKELGFTHVEINFSLRMDICTKLFHLYGSI